MATKACQKSNRSTVSGTSVGTRREGRTAVYVRMNLFVGFCQCSSTLKPLPDLLGWEWEGTVLFMYRKNHYLRSRHTDLSSLEVWTGFVVRLKWEGVFSSPSSVIQSSKCCGSRVGEGSAFFYYLFLKLFSSSNPGWLIPNLQGSEKF